MFQTAALPKTRRFLNADALIDTLRRRFADVEDPRCKGGVTYPMPDVLMAQGFEASIEWRLQAVCFVRSDAIMLCWETLYVKTTEAANGPVRRL